MVTTLDHVSCKKGDYVWEIGLSPTGYKPTVSVVEGRKNRLANPDRCWKFYAACLAECDILNYKSKKVDITQP